MKSEKKYKFHRRSIRLKEWDYGSEAAYFITLLAYQRGELLGKVVDEKMELNNFGKLIQEEWLGTPCIRINVVMDEFVIMPEHLHGIIMITDGLSKGVSQYALTEKKLVSPSNTLGAIIRGFKSLTTKRINLVRGTPCKPVWQRNYYDRVIRNQEELDNIRRYIYENPSKWSFIHEEKHELLFH